MKCNICGKTAKYLFMNDTRLYADVMKAVWGKFNIKDLPIALDMGIISKHVKLEHRFEYSLLEE